MSTGLQIDERACRHLTTALEFLGKRWNGAILLALARGADRFSVILREVPGLSDRMLAARLKELEVHGAVKRTVVPSTPVQVRYGLTDRGVRALKALQPLIGVGEHMDDEQP